MHDASEEAFQPVSALIYPGVCSLWWRCWWPMTAETTSNDSHDASHTGSGKFEMEVRGVSGVPARVKSREQAGRQGEVINLD